MLIAVGTQTCVAIAHVTMSCCCMFSLVFVCVFDVSCVRLKNTSEFNIVDSLVQGLGHACQATEVSK